MINRNISYALACLLVMGGSAAIAKKPPVPAPNIAAAVSADVKVEGEVLPPSVPIYSESVKLSFSHSFEISSQVEDALQADSTISVLGVEFSPSEDPQFQNGDKSVSIEKPYPLGIAVTAEMPVKITAKWGNNKFSVSLKGTLKTKNVAVPPSPVKILQALVGETVPVSQGIGTKAENALEFETTIVHSSIPDFSVTAWLAADNEVGTLEGATAEGVQYVAQTLKIKSKFFTTAPLP